MGDFGGYAGNPDFDPALGDLHWTPPPPRVPKERKAEPSLSNPQSFVTFVVDKEESKQTFQVHKDVAVFYSQFFKAAFDGQMREGFTQTMRLEDVDTKVFGLLVAWLYKQKLENSHTDVYNNDIVPLAKLWVLAQRCLLPVLQNTVMTTIVFLSRARPHTCLRSFMKYAYEESDNDFMKSIAAESAAFHLKPFNFADLSREFSTDMWFDVGMLMKDKCWDKEQQTWRSRTGEAKYMANESDEEKKHIHDLSGW